MSRIREDLTVWLERRNKSETISNVIALYLLAPGFRFVVSRRVFEFVKRIPIIGRLLGSLYWSWSCRRYGSEIAQGAVISGGLYIPHPYGIVIGACHLGERVTIMQNVTIGVKRVGDRSTPVIGSDCLLGAGAVVLGNVTIGKGSIIGANTVVTRDIPDGEVFRGADKRRQCDH